MKRTRIAAMALIAASLLTSCGAFFLSGQPERKTIYKLSTSQSPANPAVLIVKVDVDTEARDAAKAELGAKWKEPDTLYVWMAPRQGSATGSYYYNSYKTLHPILSIPMDGVSSHFEATFDIIANMSSSSSMNWSTSLSWLSQDVYFSEYSKDSNMDGYYLFVADGYGYGSTQTVTAQDDLSTLHFLENEPRGCGESKVALFPNASAGEKWTPIVIGKGGVTVDTLETSVFDGQKVTFTYKSLHADDAPMLTVGYGTQTMKLGPKAAVPGDDGLYYSVFDCTFLKGSGDPSGSDGIITIPMAKDATVSINISGKYNIWYWNNYTFLGTLTPLWSRQDFEDQTGFVRQVNSGQYYDEGAYQWKPYALEGFNWLSGLPSSIDRSEAVVTKGLSSGSALMVRGDNAGEYGYYNSYRHDYLDIPVGQVFSTGDLMVDYSLKCDLGSNDYVIVSAVRQDGSIYQLSYISEWNSASNQSQDTSFVDGWKRMSGRCMNFPPGETISTLRFEFHSDAWYQGRGVTIDNVQLSSVQ